MRKLSPSQWFVVILLVLGVGFGVLSLLTLATQYAVAGVGGPELPFWPVFAGLVVISLMLPRPTKKT